MNSYLVIALILVVVAQSAPLSRLSFPCEKKFSAYYDELCYMGYCKEVRSLVVDFFAGNECIVERDCRDLVSTIVDKAELSFPTAEKEILKLLKRIGRAYDDDEWLDMVMD